MNAMHLAHGGCMCTLFVCGSFCIELVKRDDGQKYTIRLFSFDAIGAVVFVLFPLVLCVCTAAQCRRYGHWFGRRPHTACNICVASRVVTIWLSMYWFSLFEREYPLDFQYPFHMHIFRIFFLGFESEYILIFISHTYSIRTVRDSKPVVVALRNFQSIGSWSLMAAMVLQTTVS